MISYHSYFRFLLFRLWCFHRRINQISPFRPLRTISSCHISRELLLGNGNTAARRSSHVVNIWKTYTTQHIFLLTSPPSSHFFISCSFFCACSSFQPQTGIKLNDLELPAYPVSALFSLVSLKSVVYYGRFMNCLKILPLLVFPSNLKSFQSTVIPSDFEPANHVFCFDTVSLILTLRVISITSVPRVPSKVICQEL